MLTPDPWTIKIKKPIKQGKSQTSIKLIRIPFYNIGLWYKRISSGGGEEIICVGGGTPPPGQTHVRAHQIDSIDDHPAVPAEKRNRWVHTNAETGEIELIEQGPQGDPGLTPFIGENGNWWIGETDTGVQAEGEAVVPRRSRCRRRPGEDGAPGPAKVLLVRPGARVVQMDYDGGTSSSVMALPVRCSGRFSGL